MSGSKFQMKSFSVGAAATNKRSQQQKLDKQRQEEDSKAAEQAYEEFVATFDNDKAKPKTFVKGGVVAPGSGERETAKQLYKPPRMEEFEQRARASVSTPPPRSESRDYSKPPKPGKKKDEPKKKSNLELFKEELKIIQEEREERHRLKGVIKGQFVDEPKDRSRDRSSLSLEDVSSDRERKFNQPYDSDDPNTTNIYMSNLDPSLTEKDLCELFGSYGPLASIKIMWPRTDEDRLKKRNYGFVAYMSRKDGERAMMHLPGKLIRGLEMRMSWSKSIVVPSVPIYIPPCMQHLTMPPSPSGLPFNCQPPSDLAMTFEEAQGLPETSERLKEIVKASTVRIVPPNDRTLLCLIHRTVEFVVREGPLFEALVMSKEFKNPMFRFLFNFQSPSHVYYRWRLFSVLQGDNPNKYRLKKFRMFKDGSWWKPPVQNPWLKGMPDNLFKKMESELRQVDIKPEIDPSTGRLERGQRSKMEQMVRGLTPEKKKVGEAMMYCVEHASAAEEIVDMLVDSLEIEATPLYKKIARFYLVSDILYNCSVRLPSAAYYRVAFEPCMTRIVKAMTKTHESIDHAETAAQFKQRVLSVLKAWQEWSLYPKDVLLQLQNSFMGFERKPLVDVDPDDDQDTCSEPDEKAAIAGLVNYGSDDSDRETKRDSDGQEDKPKFVASKWETVDPKVVEEQAVTTSKWDMFEEERGEGRKKSRSPDRDSDSQGSQSYADRLDSERRTKLRDIECEVLRLQDELERKRKYSRNDIQEQCRILRDRLLRKMEEEERHDRNRDRREPRRRHDSDEDRREPRRRHDSDEDRRRDRNRDKRRRSPSPKRRSPSPYRKRDRKY